MQCTCQLCALAEATRHGQAEDRLLIKVINNERMEEKTCDIIQQECIAKVSSKPLLRPYVDGSMFKSGQIKTRSDG